jgi:opacity protein-like surface antigen
MKFLIAAASVAVVAVAAPAFAQIQPTANTGAYGNLGYSNFGIGDANVNAIQGRLGYRFNDYIGVEGEVAAGLNKDKVNIAPGVDAKVKLNHEEAIYGVGFLPLSPRFDLLGRVGYGHSKISTSIPGAGIKGSDGEDSWNFGGGAQYRLDPHNGIRAEYTRQEFQGHDAGHADVWSVGYNRKF